MKLVVIGIAFSAMVTTAAIADHKDLTAGASGNAPHHDITKGDTRSKIERRDWTPGQRRREPRHKICYWHHNHRHCRWTE